MATHDPCIFEPTLIREINPFDALEALKSFLKAVGELPKASA
jgi:hypothetical protein